MKTLLITLDKTDWVSRLNKDRRYSCVYLGRDYECLLQLKQTASANCQFIDIGELLEQVSRELRRPYLDYIGLLSKQHASLAWWISRVAEKNVMASPVYLYVCYLVVVCSLLQNQLKDRNVCLVAESPALLETIKHLPEFSNFKISGSSGYHFNLVNSCLKAIYKMIKFVYHSLLTKVLVGLDRNTKKEDRPLTVIRTWVGENNLGEDGRFKDSYFPGLADYLEQQGQRVAILPILYNVERSFKESLHWFRQAKNQFIIPEDFYHLSDYLRTIYLSFRSASIFREKFNFNRMDISRLFREEAAKNIFAVGPLNLIMQYFLPKRLKNKGQKIEKFIITFENMFPEKPLILGVARYMPGVKVLGFQHASLFPLLLSGYTSTAESNVLPMPNKIVTSGNFFKQILAKEGFPSNKLVAGPALRFQYLLSLSNNRNGQLAKVILLPLPLARSSALELLSKVWAVVKERRGLSVKIKAHPMMSADELAGIVDKAGWLKDRYQTVSGPMVEALSQVTLVIAMASATIFDAVASGVPVIRVRSDVDLSLDPMDWFPADNSSYVARTSAQISAEVDRIIALRQSDLLELKNKGKELVDLCFSPVTKETMAAFIN